MYTRILGFIEFRRACTEESRFYRNDDVNHAVVLSNTDIDNFISELQNWKVVFNQFPL